MTIIAFVLTGFIVATGMNGCQVTDFVKVNVPLPVQKATNSPPKVTLTDAPDVLEAYIASGDKFHSNMAKGYEWVGFLSALGTTGFEMGKSAIPGGALGLSLLSLAGGIFIKGPGTAKEKNDSYNKGLKEGQALANAAVAAIKS